MRLLLKRSARNKVQRFVHRHRLVYDLVVGVRHVINSAFELGGRSPASSPPWAVDWHPWITDMQHPLVADGQQRCATCGLRGVKPGTLHRALDLDESDASGTFRAGWVVAVTHLGEPLTTNQDG